MFENVPTDPSAFQAYARRWLAENAPPPPNVRLPLAPNELTTREQLDYLQAWQRKAYDAGLVGCDYPKEYGGGGHTGFQRIANQEMARARVPYLVNLVGLSMAAPTILVHGTEEQKRRFLPGALRADEIWCQGFSEPGAGSDMANQQTFAERRGDVWIVNGHKVWTSYGRFAQWMILLARTEPRRTSTTGSRYFLCPIAGHPGVTVRPLVKITGDGGFNEVLFENVEIAGLAAARRGGEGLDRRDDDAHVRARRGGDPERRRRTAQVDPIARLVALAKRTVRDGVLRRGRPGHARRDRPRGDRRRGHPPEPPPRARAGALRSPAARAAPEQAHGERVASVARSRSAARSRARPRRSTGRTARRRTAGTGRSPT